MRRASQLDRLITRTRRRLLLADAVVFGGRSLRVSTAIALLAAVADRFLALGLPLWCFGAAALSAAPVAAVLVWRRRATALTAAARLDEALRLKDLLGTALAIDNDESAMARLVREDAQRLAGRVDARAATRIQWPLSWGAAALASAACALLLWLVEPRNVFARPAQTQEIAAAQAVRQRVARALHQRADELRAAAQSRVADSSSPSEAAREALRTLDRLAEQFSAASEASTSPQDDNAPHDSKTPRGRLEEDAELSRAASEAIEVAERLEREVLLARQAQREVAQRLARIAPMHEGDPAEKFTDALRRGDLSSAAKWIEEMDKRLKEASEEERERLAESLRRAAEELAGAAEDPPLQQAAPHQALDELDLPAEQLQEWIESPPVPDKIRRILQDQQRDPIDAQHLAEQIQRELLERAAEERAKRRVEDAAREIRDLADAVHPPLPDETPPQGEAPQQGPQNQPKASGEAARPEERARPEARPATRPGEAGGNELRTTPQPTPQQGEPQPAENEQRPPMPREAETPSPREEKSPARQPGQNPREDLGRPSGEQSGQKPAESPDARPGAYPADTPAPKGGGEREGIAEGGRQTRPQTGDEGERIAPSAGEQTENAAARGEPPPGEASQSPTVEERIRRVREVLDEIERSGRAADEQQEISREMRKAAEDLLSQMSPQERREIERWAAQRAREQGQEPEGNRGSPESLLSRARPTRALEAPAFEYETQDVDLTDRIEGTGDRVIAEMFGGESPHEGGEIDRRPMSDDPARRAAQAIERALNEEAIPPRYRALIRAWAQRLPRTVESRERSQE